MHTGKQHPQCHDCGRQVVDCCDQDLVSDNTRALLERLLVARLSVHGICRAVSVPLTWLQGLLVQCIEALSDHLHVQPVSRTQDAMIQRLAVEADAMARCVQKQANT